MVVENITLLLWYILYKEDFIWHAYIAIDYRHYSAYLYIVQLVTKSPLKYIVYEVHRAY